MAQVIGRWLLGMVLVFSGLGGITSQGGAQERPSGEGLIVAVVGDGQQVGGLCLIPVSPTFGHSVCDNAPATDARLTGRPNPAPDDDPTNGIIVVSSHPHGVATYVIQPPPDWAFQPGTFTQNPVVGPYWVSFKGTIQIEVRPGRVNQYTIFLERAPGTGASTSAQSGAPGPDEIVELFPGYPGYRGVVPGLVGRGDTAYLSDLLAQDPSFSKEREDAANRAVARRLGITGDIPDWTWEIWMAIGAERGYGHICYVCMWTGELPVAPVGPPLVGMDHDPRLQLWSHYSDLFLRRFAAERGMHPFLTVTDADLRIFASLVHGGYPTAADLIQIAEQLLAAYVEPGGGVLRPERVRAAIICRSGHVPVPLSANLADQDGLAYLSLMVAATNDLGGVSPMWQQILVRMIQNDMNNWMLADPISRFADYLRAKEDVTC